MNKANLSEMAEKNQVDPDAEMSPEEKEIFDQIMGQVVELGGCKYDRETGDVSCDVTEDQAQMISKPVRKFHFNIVKPVIAEMGSGQPVDRQPVFNPLDPLGLFREGEPK